jgi:hypothetical protein
MRKIKMIWEFRGPNAMKTAEHHEIHLKEYLQQEKMEYHFTQCNAISEFEAEAVLVVDETHMNLIRQALKPHRGQVYQE